MTRALLALLAVAACTPPPPDVPPPTASDAGVVDEPADSVEALDPDLVACDRPDAWPFSLASTTLPVDVRYRARAEQAAAEEILALVEEAWAAQRAMGWRAPPSDDGACGDDDRFDVFVWRGHEDVFVDVLNEIDGTPHEDWAPYMVLDPDGAYGGDVLDAIVAHELNHALQAADDWWEPAFVYEATASFVSDLVFDDTDEWTPSIYDFQLSPELPLSFDDAYETFYMYGAALYFFFLRDYVFEGDVAFAADLWLRMRDVDADDNEPDFEDAMDALLAERDLTYDESLIEFSRWRWFTGAHDDGAHFEPGEIPDDAEPWSESAALSAGTWSPPDPPFLDGVVYVELIGAPGAVVDVALAAADDDVVHVVQALPGIAPDTDGERIDVAAGPAAVTLGDDGTRTLAVLALPAVRDDPDERAPPAPRPFTLTWTPP